MRFMVASLSGIFLSQVLPVLAQGSFENVTVTTSIQVSNLPSFEGELSATASQGKISGVIYYNNCNFTSTLIGNLNYPNGSLKTINLTSGLKANNSEWVKFSSLQVPDNSSVILSATASPGPNAAIPFSFTTVESSDCNARVTCTGSPLDYTLTLEGFQCFDSTIGTVATYGLCGGLYLGSSGLSLPCQPGNICTYSNQFDSQCLPI